MGSHKRSRKARRFPTEIKPVKGSVDVVITCRRTANRLGPCLAALAKGLPSDAKLYVSDAVPRNTAEELHVEIARTARTHGVRVDRSGRNIWDARNRGASSSLSPLILFIDGDAVLQDGSWDALSEVIVREDVVAIGGMCVWADGLFPAHMEQNLPPADVRIKTAGYAFGNSLVPYARFAAWGSDHPKLYARDDLQAVPITFMLIKRAHFAALGGFAEGEYQSAPYAEAEVCIRLREQGLLIAFEPRAVAVCGAEPVAMSHDEFQFGVATLRRRLENLIQYDECFLL